MKLLNFEFEGTHYFGIAIKTYAIAFERLFAEGDNQNVLASMMAYLENSPESFNTAKRLQDKAIAMIERQETNGFLALDKVKILPVLSRPTALIDVGMTPRHVIQSARVLLMHQFGAFLGKIATSIIARKIKKTGWVRPYPYYKCNHLTVIGDHDEVSWPAYTSYLDIEPELGIVIGNLPGKIAGYTIFNDASARDIQFPEMVGSGPARSKDFERGNGLGPFLVTPDEVGDPLNLKVDVNIGDRLFWKGHTSEHAAHPSEVISYFQTIFDLQPGMIIGMGTTPDCTGLDNDVWLLPGEMVKITYEKLGTLHQRISSTLPKLEQSKWKYRPELEKFQRK